MIQVELNTKFSFHQLRKLWAAPTVCQVVNIPPDPVRVRATTIRLILISIAASGISAVSLERSRQVLTIRGRSSRPTCGRSLKTRQAVQIGSDLMELA
ncbi:hypothetical protein RRG08_040789 [Elysia crispata]|uniref:Uncharacterized protein n=1 Tax=Elysia crispata TaxID=231223 RepID=A0AAE1BGB2_9GAST|nr:hypothetical protein RRG08_040789 [Elysia crispata]